MEVFISTAIYILTYVLSALCLSFSRKNKRRVIDLYFIIAVLLPVLLAAFRVNTGTDYANYVSIYETNRALSFGQWFVSNRGLDDTRLGIWLISRVAGIFNSPKMFFAIIALIIYCPVAVFIKYNFKNVTFLAAFIFLMTLFSSGLNISKQILAASVLLCGIKFVMQRKFFRYVLVVLLAMCFHVTAVVGIAIYFLDGRTRNGRAFGKTFTIVAVCGAIALLPQLLNLLGGRFSGYILYSGVINNRSFIVDFILLVVFFVLRKHYLRLNRHNDVWIFMFLLGCIFEFTGFLSPYIKRIASYFTMAQVFLLAQIPLLFKKRDRKFASFAVFLYATAMFVLTSSVMGQAELVPYYTDLRIGLTGILILDLLGLVLLVTVRAIGKERKCESRVCVTAKQAEI